MYMLSRDNYLSNLSLYYLAVEFTQTYRLLGELERYSLLHQGKNPVRVALTEKGEEIYKGAIKAKLIDSKDLKDVKPGKFLVEKIGGIKRTKCKSFELKKKS